MFFLTKIFIPSKKPILNFTISQKLQLSGLFLFFCCAVIGNKNNQFIYLVFFSSLLFLYGIFKRFNEYENLNGSFEGEFEISENSFVINSVIINFNQISQIKLAINNYDGQHIGSMVKFWGPAFYQGINNFFSVKSEDNSIININFYLDSESHRSDLNYVIFNIICDEKIEFRKNYLNYIKEDFRDTSKFQLFIVKLLKEKKISIIEGNFLLNDEYKTKNSDIISNYF